ncbi:MAG: hypothetical protein IKQ81_03475 [Clostridiales bacterium]|nr:hypothetical protein [Clostridiales bacterium]
MSRYLGTLKILNGFVNFMPLFRLDENLFSRLSPQEKEELLPESTFKNVVLFSSNEERFSFADRFDDKQLLIVDLDLSEFEENLTASGDYNKTRYRFDVTKLDSSQYGTIDKFGYYYYVKASEATGDFNKSYRIIENPLIRNDFPIVIETDGRSNVAGPFKVRTRTENGENVVTTHRTDNRSNDLYLIDTIALTGEPNEFQTIYINDDHYCLFFAGKKTRSYLDVMSDEELINGFRRSISNKVANNGFIDLKNIDGLVNAYNTSGYYGLPSDIKASRLARLKTILASEKELDEQTENVTELIADILLKNNKSDSLSPVFQLLAENSDFLGSVPQIKVFRTKIQDLEDEVAEKNQELQQIEARISEKKQEEVEERLNKEYDELNNKIASARNELNALSKEIDKYRGAMTSQEYLEYLDKEIEYRERVNSDRKVESEIIEKNIDSIFSERTEKALDLTFDGMISQKMIQAAAEWETEQENQQYVDVVNSIANNTRAPMSNSELVDYLCNTIALYRPNYDKNTVLNLYICLAQGFLTVFSGAPGAGKTSICNILAHSLGLMIPSDYVDAGIPIDPNRYIDVSVERGWTSKRDFIGYYNPLTKKFDRNNSRLFDALNILNIEATEMRTDRPFVILLDEANLSPMEYYWADFMNACDDLNENSSVDLGESYRFIIPDELRFVATINNDHTTEALSPRLIDRAWVIKLPNSQPGLGKTLRFEQNDNKEILWSEFVDAFSTDSGDVTGTAKDIYEGFITKSKKVGIRVSPRSDSAIRRYWSVASRIMVKDESTMVDPSIIALDYAIAQKILPQISGSGESVEEGLKDLKSYSQDKNLNMTASLLDEILVRGENNMHFFQYFG